MDWALHQQQVRFDIRAERAEYEYLFKHPARVLQDRLARLGGGDRTGEIPIAEWGEPTEDGEAKCPDKLPRDIHRREKTDL
jgi:hypothetical protein